jgi:hypothetical protein
MLKLSVSRHRAEMKYGNDIPNPVTAAVVHYKNGLGLRDSARKDIHRTVDGCFDSPRVTRRNTNVCESI